MKSFNQLNNVFISEISKIFEDKEGKRIIKEYISLIKNDPALKAQLEFYKQLEEGVSKEFKEDEKLMEEYVSNIPTIFGGLSKKELIEANEKFHNFLHENSLTKNTELVESIDNVVKAAEYLIYEGKRNLEEYIKNKHVIINEIKVKTDSENYNPNLLDEVLEDFDSKYGDKLTEDQIQIINKLILPNGLNEVESIIREEQKNCIDSLNRVLSECDDIDIKGKLLQLKETVLFNDIKDPIDSFIELNEIKEIINEINL